jgi:hypothetical protein
MKRLKENAWESLGLVAVAAHVGERTLFFKE